MPVTDPLNQFHDPLLDYNLQLKNCYLPISGGGDACEGKRMRSGWRRGGERGSTSLVKEGVTCTIAPVNSCVQEGSG